MKLYYSPGACSLSPHIVAHEAGLKLELVKVDLQAKKLEDGSDFLAINPKGYVPTLQLDDGKVITEGVAIDMYLSSLKPEAGLVPLPSDPAFLEFFQQILFITTELHKGMGGLFAPLPDEAKDAMRKKLRTRLAFAATQLKGKQFLFGEHFTAADAYLFTVLRWAPNVQVDLSEWPVFAEFSARMGERASVKAAMEMEGIPAAKKAA